MYSLYKSVKEAGNRDKFSAGFKMDFKKACTNCGELNYHIENDISFITGKSGFHVCNVCGLKALNFPKLSLKEIKKLKKDFTKKPKLHFEKVNKKHEMLSFIFMFALLIILLLFVLVSV